MKLYTDDEAKRKVCWNGRNRVVLPEIETRRPTIVSADQHCVGSLCMAWELVEESSIPEERKGFCSLLPKPQIQ